MKIRILKNLSENKILWLVVIPVFLVILNAVLVYPLFQGEYTQFMGSIESVFIADARYIIENFPHYAWQPFWYAGFPFRLVYTPIVPYLLAILNSLFTFFSISHWYRILVGLAYVLTPASLFFLTRYLLKKNLGAFLASFSFSLLSFPAFFLAEIRNESYSFGQAPWSLITALYYGEGPHIMAMAFLPLVILFFLKALREPSFRNKILSAIFIVLTALINWISLVALAVILAIVLLSEIINGRAAKKFKTAFLITIIAYGLSAFWLNLSFLKSSLSISTGGVAGGVFGNYSSILPLLLIILPVVVFLASSFFKKTKKSQPLFITLIWFFIFYFSALFWYKYQKMFLPQPNRYVPEMGMAAAIILAIIFNYFYQRINFKKPKVKYIARIIFTIVVVGLIVWGAKNYFRSSLQITSPHQNIEATSEYKIAEWLEANVKKETRVFLTGSQAFWLNTFSDVAQLRGGNEGVANPWTQHATYQIYHEPDADISIDWAKAFNIGYLVVNFPESANIYHDYISVGKFEGELPEVYNKRGDVVYKVALKYPGLAQVVDVKRVENLRTPAKGDDRKNIKAYAFWVDNEAKRNAEINWINNSEFTVRAEIQNDEALQLQMTYDNGWKAKVGGRNLKIRKDVIGNMYVIPSQIGPLEIKFKYGKTWDVWFGYLITLLTIILIFFYNSKLRRNQKNYGQRKKSK